MLGLLISPMLLQSVSSVKADEQSVVSSKQETVVSNLSEDGEYFGPTPAREKTSKNILDDLPKDNPFKYIHGDGSDLRAMAPDAYGRAATVQLYMKHANGSYTVGTGAFVGNRTILTVAHNFLKPNLDNTTNDITDIWFVVGSNTPFQVSGFGWNSMIKPTSGTMYHVDKSQLRFFNQQNYSSNSSKRKDKVLWENDVAVIQIKDPFPILAKKQGLKNDEVIRIASLDELLQFNKAPVNTQNVVINGYPGSARPGTKGFESLAKAIIGGVQYRAASVISNKVGYTTKGADLDSGTIFEFRNTAVGGMSGSAVLNEKGNLVGTYHFSAAGSPVDGSAGGVLFSKAHHTWLTNLVKENTATGWYDLDGTRYYLGDDGNIVKNKTLVIDGHLWSFDGNGRSTDKGEYFETKVFVKRVDESGKEIEARQEVGKATTLVDFKWDGATKYAGRDASFKEAWLLKTTNGLTNQKVTIKAEKGKSEVEIVEVYQSQWKPLNRTSLTKTIETVKANAKDRESKLPTKGFEAYASAELAGKLNTAQVNYNKALIDAENLVKATNDEDRNAKRTQKVIDDAEKVLRESDTVFEPLIKEYAKVKSDERVSASTVLNNAVQYLKEHNAEDTKSVKADTVKQYTDAKTALQKAIDAQTQFLTSNKSNNLFKSVDLKNGTDAIKKAQADLEASVAKIASENSSKSIETKPSVPVTPEKPGATKPSEPISEELVEPITPTIPSKPVETKPSAPVDPEELPKPIIPTIPSKPVETKPTSPVTTETPTTPTKPVETKPSIPEEQKPLEQPVTPTIPTKPSEPLETKPSAPVTTEKPKQLEQTLKPVTPKISTETKSSDLKDSTKPKELPKTSEHAKQRNTTIITLLSLVGLGSVVSYMKLRKRD